MKTTAIRSATVLASTLLFGGVALGGMVAAPLSAFAYYGAIPYQSPASSACSSDYDQNCFIEETNYLNNTSLQYEGYTGNAGYSYVNNYSNQNYNQNYNQYSGQNSYNTNSYYGNSWNTPSYNTNYSYSSPSYGSYTNSYVPYNTNQYNNYGLTNYSTNYGQNNYTSYSTPGFHNPASYAKYGEMPESYSYQYQYQYHY